MKILMTKTMSGQLAPLNDEEAEFLKKIKAGNVVECEVVQKRNPLFMRKWFALLKIGFDAFEEGASPVYYLGEPVKANFERFRKDITVLAGFYEPVFTIKGDLRLEPMSVSFSSMDEEVFEKLYSATIDVLLRRILGAAGYDEAKLRATVDQVMRFDN